MPEVNTKLYTGSEQNRTTYDYNLDAHNSQNMKLDRPKVAAAEFTKNLPSNNMYYSHNEAKNKLAKLNNDIYQGTKQEKSKHEFNFKRYFTIFSILALLTAAFAYFRRGRGK